MVNDGICVPCGEAAFDLRALSAAELGVLQARITAGLSGFTGLSWVMREDLVGEAIACALGSRRLDAVRCQIAYAVKIAQRQAADMLRESATVRLVDDVGVLESAAAGRDLHDGTGWGEGEPTGGRRVWGPSDADELIAATHAAIASLDPSQMRDVAVLRSAGMPVREVSEHLGIPRNQVDQQWYRAVQKVRAVPQIKDRLRQSHTRRRTRRTTEDGQEPNAQ